MGRHYVAAGDTARAEALEALGHEVVRVDFAKIEPFIKAFGDAMSAVSATAKSAAAEQYTLTELLATNVSKLATPLLPQEIKLWAKLAGSGLLSVF